MTEPLPASSWMGRDHYPVEASVHLVEASASIASDGTMTGDPQDIADLLEFVSVRANLNSDLYS